MSSPLRSFLQSGSEILHPSLFPLQPVRVGVFIKTLTIDDSVAVPSRAYLQLPCPPQVTEPLFLNAFFNI